MFKNAQEPETLWAEVVAAEDVRDDRLRKRRERIARVAGPYASSRMQADYEPENRLWEYLAYVTPRVAYANPSVRIRSRRTGMPDDIARALQASVNHVIEMTKLRRALRTNCLDFMLDFGPMMVAPRPIPGSKVLGNDIWWPHAYTVEPHTYFQDPLGRTPDELMFQGHAFLRSKDALIAEAEEKGSDWNLNAVKELTEEAGVEKVHYDRRNVPRRGEVCIREVFVPEFHDDLDVDPEDGYSGTIYTLGASQGSTNEQPYFLRPPRAFYGPPGGPYRLAAFMYLPEIAYGVSPTIPAEAQIQDLARTSRSILRDAANHKVMSTYPANDPVAAQAIGAEDTYAIPVKPGTVDSIKPLEVGGVSQQRLLHFDIKSRTADRVLGMDDPQRGLIGGGGTATEASIAQQASDIRTGDIIQVYQDFVTEIVTMMAWYCFHDERFVALIEGEDMPNVLVPGFKGGPGGDLRWEDLDLSIEPYSMSYESEMSKQQRVARTMETVSWLAQSVPAAPWLPWDKILPEVVEDLHLGEALGEIDVAGAVAWAAQMQQMELPEKPQTKVFSGRQVSGRPLNVTLKSGQGRPAEAPKGLMGAGQASKATKEGR